MKYIYSLRQAMDDLIKDKNAYILGEDITEPYGGAFKVTKGLSEKYPDNVIATPMSEQGITAFCVGMAVAGDYVIEEIMFGDFITLTADQLINHAAKFYDLYGDKLHLVVRTPSGGYRGYGATHSQSLEKMFLGIPGLDVVAANIYSDPGALLKKTMEKGKPTLFIENKLDYPKELVLDDFDIFNRISLDDIVRLEVRGEKPEWTIVTYGGISAFAVDAAKKLMFDEEIATDVLVVSALNEWEKLSSAIRSEKILVLEEGVADFGWGSQVVSAFANEGKKVYQLGAKNSSIPSAKKAEADVLVQVEDIIGLIMRHSK